MLSRKASKRPNVVLHPQDLWTVSQLESHVADECMKIILANMTFPPTRGTFMRHKVPRDQNMFSFVGPLTYKFGGRHVVSVPAPTWLIAMTDTLLASPGWPTEFRPDIVLVNRYKNGDDSISLHADDEPEIDQKAPIVSVSLGATRTFVIQKKHKPEGEKRYMKAILPLTHGDLLVMLPGMQRDHLHSLPKDSTVLEQRINLTFRCVQNVSPIPATVQEVVSPIPANVLVSPIPANVVVSPIPATVQDVTLIPATVVMSPIPATVQDVTLIPATVTIVQEASPM